MSEPIMTGPPCDVCQAEPALMSLMNLADYSQVKLGANCAPTFLTKIAADMATAGSQPEQVPGQLELAAEPEPDVNGAPETAADFISPAAGDAGSTEPLPGKLPDGPRRRGRQ